MIQANEMIVLDTKYNSTINGTKFYTITLTELLKYSLIENVLVNKIENGVWPERVVSSRKVKGQSVIEVITDEGKRIYTIIYNMPIAPPIV